MNLIEDTQMYAKHQSRIIRFLYNETSNPDIIAILAENPELCEDMVLTRVSVNNSDSDIYPCIECLGKFYYGNQCILYLEKYILRHIRSGTRQNIIHLLFSCGTKMPVDRDLVGYTILYNYPGISYEMKIEKSDNRVIDNRIQNLQKTPTPLPVIQEIRETQAAQSAQEPQVPNTLLCPISHEIMENPVIVSSGITYDEKNIKEWLSRGNTKDPLTREVLTKCFYPNFLIKGYITNFRENKPIIN